MRRRFFFSAGIGAEILLLLLIAGAWPGSAPGRTIDQKAADTVRTEGSAVEGSAVEGSAAEDSEAEDGAAEGEIQEKEDYIKWVEFNVSYEALNQAYTYDVETYQEEIHLNWIDLLAYLGAKYGGDFTAFREKDMTEAAEKILSGETTMEEMTANMEYYGYYREAYGAVLDGMVGEYEIEKPQEADSGKKEWKKYYGLKAYSPIAKEFPYTDYDDFGVSRSYGYRRNHLGHDLMGQVGTPVTAVESGYVAVMGWNQYGGWRIGINSFDGRRYYYYAHLRQNVPFAESLEEGDVVQAGDVIGYMGRTGYSTTENVNNIDTYHLHFGLQLIFDESQREGNHEIWVDVYPLVRFLSQNRSEVVRNDANKEWYRKYEIKDPAAEAYLKTLSEKEK